MRNASKDARMVGAEGWNPNGLLLYMRQRMMEMMADGSGRTSAPSVGRKRRRLKQLVEEVTTRSR